MTHTLWHPLLAFACALIFAPVIQSIIVKTKAFFAGRQGAPLLQPYFDLYKSFSKGSVYSTTTTYIFRSAIIVSAGAILLALILLPAGKLGSFFSFEGDIVVFVMLLGLARFATVLLALDTGSSFCGMGASREIFFSALAEPVLLLSIVALCKGNELFSLVAVCGPLADHQSGVAILIGASLFVILLTENSRIPIDDPCTHLELTMIHEVMILDVSGPDFGIVEYVSSIKLWIFSLLLSRILNPFHVVSPYLDFLITLAGIFLIALLIGIIESTMARLKLSAVPQLLLGAGALSIVALLLVNGAFT